MPPNRDTTARPNDYIYGKYHNCSNSSIPNTLLDPLFIVSGPKDHLKAALIAKASMAKFVSGHPNLSTQSSVIVQFQQICPIFPSMFSDLPHCPRQQIIMRKASEPLPPYVNKTTEDLNKNADTMLYSKNVDVHGVDRHRYFYWSVQDNYK